MTETKNGRTMILSQCDVCGSKKSKFIKKQEASGILCSLGIKTPSSKIPFYGDVFFLKTILLKKDERIMYKNNVILSKVWRKNKKH